MLVRDMPQREQPVNRVCDVGASNVSLVELLATLLQSSNALAIAEALIERFGDLVGLLRAEVAELEQVKGIGKGQAARLKAALELGVRVRAVGLEQPTVIRAPGDAARIVMPDLSYKGHELFMVLHLNTRNHVIDKEVLYKGTVNTTIVRVSEVFRGAIARNCAGIIVAHNHPSGDLSPSPEDVTLTRRLVEAGKLVEIDVLDHLIIGHNSYKSLRESNTGFEAA